MIFVNNVSIPRSKSIIKVSFLIPYLPNIWSKMFSRTDFAFKHIKTVSMRSITTLSLTHCSFDNVRAPVSKATSSRTKCQYNGLKIRIKA